MSEPLRSADRPAVPSGRKLCLLSRHRGWLDPTKAGRSHADVNLLAVYLGAPVRTLETAWAAVFGALIPPTVARAYRGATARAKLSEAEVRSLEELAERLQIELRVID